MPAAAAVTPRDLEVQLVRPAAHPSGEASSLQFFAAQFARHLVPVMGSRTLADGVVAPALARLIGSNPEAASVAQAGIAVWSAARLTLSHVNTASAPDVAEAAFSGFHGDPPRSTRRKVWQGIQRAGVLTGDVLSVALTATSVNQPSLKRIAQTIATIQVRAHLLPAGREFLRPAINTVHVGSNAPGVSWPATGRNLRAQDINGKMSLQYGLAAGAIELISQTLMQVTLGGKPAWEACARLAAAAGAVSGLANTVTSSFEDHLVDSASARRMQETDPAHVRHLRLESLNPFSYRELGRQLERVDVRSFNQMLPAMLAAGILYGLEKMLPAHSTQADGEALSAGINALVSAVILGGLLAVTTQTYQLNDGVRDHHADRRMRA